MDSTELTPSLTSATTAPVDASAAVQSSSMDAHTQAAEVATTPAPPSVPSLPASAQAVEAPQAPQVQPESIPPTSDGDSVSASAPIQSIEHSSAGLAGVAAFLPADAKLDHPTPSPSEPLGDGAADINGDIVMGDAEASLPKATPGSGTDAPAPDAPAASVSVPQMSDTDQLESPKTNGIDSSASLPVISQPPQEAQPTTSLQGQNDAAIPPTLPSQIEPLVNGMVSLPTESSVSLTRGREQDEGAEEPNAKRARLDAPLAAETSQPQPLAQDADIIPAVPVTNAPPPTPAVAAPSTIAPLVPAAAPAPTAATPGQLPGRSTYSTEPLTKLQKKLVEEKLKNTKKVKSAGPFLRPVDAVALNIPHYTNVIKTPMDLATMENKLKTDQYESLESFVQDFELMVNNCFTFNGPAHAVSVMAQNLRAYFLKQMDSVPTGINASTAPPKPIKKEAPAAKPLPRREARMSAGPPVAKSPTATDDRYALMPTGVPQIRRDSTAGRPKRTVIPPPSRDLPYSGVKPKRKENQAGLKFCDHVLDEMRKPKYHQMTMFFAEPVDPVALNIPHYFSIVKHPMDISTITNKQKTGQYSSADDFKADFDLMLGNCFKFNPPENGVHIAGKQLQSEFDALWKTKSDWVKKNQPRSQRVTPTSDDSASEEESSEDEAADGNDEKEATIRALKEQLATMQNMLGAISGVKRESPKASSKKKSRTSTGGSSKSKKSGGASSAKVSTKAKNPKKQRLVTYEEKQEISNATENMTEDQANRLTAIITENVAKYKNMTDDDVELEIDDLPNDVQHKLLKYVRSIFPRQRDSEPAEDIAIDDDYEPASRAGKGGKRKHKPMKKAEQDSRIAQLSAKVEAMKDGVVNGGPGGAGQADSSGDEDSESSEEE